MALKKYHIQALQKMRSGSHSIKKSLLVMMFSSLVDRYLCFNETKLQGMEKKKQIPQKLPRYRVIKKSLCT